MSNIDRDFVPINLQVFETDDHGCTFGDILRDPDARKALSLGLAIINSAEAQRRLVNQIERVPAVRERLARRNTDADRLKMALGTAVRIVMERRGWRRTGRKSAVGVGEFFSRAERYER
jgi:hypothetical protein